MTVNESNVDRIIRAVLGAALVLIALLAIAGTTLKIVLIVVGALLLITALIGFCPLYKLLGISTHKK